MTDLPGTDRMLDGAYRLREALGRDDLALPTMRSHRDVGNGQIGDLLAAACDRIDVLVEALDWYAEPTRYVPTQIPEPRSVVHSDGGQLARRTLGRPDE